MKINPLALLAGIALFFMAGVGGGFLLNNALLGGSGESTEVVSAPTLDPNIPPTLSYSQLQAENERLLTQVAILSQPSEMTPEAQAPQIDEPALDTASARVLFRITTDESEVRFNIYEELNGAPFTVVGKTNQLAGDVVVDFANPNASQVGEIRIDLRSLRTDNGNRDNAIRGRILQSAQDQYQFGTFKPTDIIGLPSGAVSVGDTITFTLVGDLTLVATTRSVSFEVTLTVESDTRLKGSGVAVVDYNDFNLRIPSVPSVANVADEVTLEIDFVALRVEN